MMTTRRLAEAELDLLLFQREHALDRTLQQYDDELAIERVYRVQMSQTIEYTVLVDATSEAEALALAPQLVSDGATPVDTEYGGALALSAEVCA